MQIEFIIPTYDRVNPLISMLASLMAQNNYNWKAHVIIDNNVKMPAEDIVKTFNDEKIYYSYMDKRYNDYGHTPRNKGKNESTANYVVMTGDDNYYVPTFVADILEVAENKESPGMIYCDMIHSHHGYLFFECGPNLGCIDIGAFAMRTDIAKQINLGKTYAADGHFIEEYKARFPNEKTEKIKRVLYVHN